MTSNNNTPPAELERQKNAFIEKLIEIVRKREKAKSNGQNDVPQQNMPVSKGTICANQNNEERSTDE
jgi:hypothetical protein